MYYFLRRTALMNTDGTSVIQKGIITQKQSGVCSMFTRQLPSLLGAGHSLRNDTFGDKCSWRLHFCPLKFLNWGELYLIWDGDRNFQLSQVL